jgi:chromosomal replication initiator protein
LPALDGLETADHHELRVDAPRLGMPDMPPIGNDPHTARLVAKYRFDSFVVGPSNRFAYAAAQAVAEQPGTNYNPLFIYGGAGLGKTHLLNAIGHQAMEMYPGLGVRYVTSETFLTEFIDGIRRKRTGEFKNRYRSTDILLLDDVQFFEGKEQILEEFFHTFNSLYEYGKQLVISSDRHPRHLSTLEDRLRSRFEWGLLTDIQPPDVETRLAILKHNAEFSARAVPTEVLQFIASLVSDNIRELEGALTRVTAFAALTQQTIDLHMAERVLQDLLPGHESKSVDAPQIIRATAASYGFSVDDLEGPSRRQPLVLSRQVAMYLCRELTDLSLPKIGNLFGGRDHTTVMHAVEKIRRLMETDREVFDRVSELTQSLRRTRV